jgi:iron(III) transport system ATP-binding protein
MIEIRSLCKSFRSGRQPVAAVNGVDLEVNDEEFVVLLGPSGSGKTTLLRCLAGLEKPDAGEIILGDQIVSSQKLRIFLGPEDRGIGMVFQSYAVWPHMTVFQNVAFPLLNSRNKRLPRSEVKNRVLRALELVQLCGLEDRPAPFLSGGQQQRVALARALAVEPRVLLMDEPLSNLDARLREEVRDEIRILCKRLKITAVYVTHDQIEAMALADKIAVMSQGRILQVGRAYDLYSAPLDRSVCEFFGTVNQFPGKGQGADVLTGFGMLKCSTPTLEGSKVIVAIRPEDVQLNYASSGSGNEFAGTVLAQNFLGDITIIRVRLAQQEIRCKTLGTDRRLRPGCEAYVRFPPDRIMVFME